jgi:hypothetical protein
MSHLVAETLEDRSQPALLSLNLPGISLMIATESPVVAEVVVARGANVFVESARPSGESSLPIPPVNNPPTTVPAVRTPSMPMADVASISAAAPPAAGTSLPVPTANESAVEAASILLPPNENDRAFAASADSPVAFAPTSSPVAMSPLTALPSSTFLVPTILSAVGAGSTALPAEAPAPREADALPPQPEAELAVAPMPREVSVSEPPSVAVQQVSAAPPSVEQQPVATMFAITEVPEAVESNWGWIGAASAVLIAGGYWVMRTLRLRRPSSMRAAAKRLPYGTILSTDLQPA